VRKSRKIRELEVRVEELSAIVDILIVLVNDIIDEKTKPELDSGKWYQQRP
jgi:hypothetical protein